jgi:hypothetical protein
MGCDIHFYVEIKNAQGVWALAPGQLVPCERCGGTQLDPEHKHCGNCKKKLSEHEPDTGKCWFDFTKLDLVPDPCNYECLGGNQLTDSYYPGGRNYELFGILSGVRTDAVPGFTQENRGMPADPSPELAKASLEPDWHSHTWYTLDELSAHDWDQHEYISEFQAALEKMRKLAEQYEDVRAVFWYDN